MGNFAQWGNPDAATPREGRRLSSCKLLFRGTIMTVPRQQAPANSVPAAAVIRGGRALFGITGRKGRVGGARSSGESPGLNPGRSRKTIGLECWRGKRNFWCSGEMRRYQKEHRRRRRLAGQQLTLRRESQGANGIRYPGSPGRKRWVLGVGSGKVVSVVENSLSTPPGEYDRKIETQRN